MFKYLFEFWAFIFIKFLASFSQKKTTTTITLINVPHPAKMYPWKPKETLV